MVPVPQVLLSRSETTLTVEVTRGSGVWARVRVAFFLQLVTFPVLILASFPHLFYRSLKRGWGCWIHKREYMRKKWSYLKEIINSIYKSLRPNCNLGSLCKLYANCALLHGGVPICAPRHCPWEFGI